jgi:hypothetical protein
MKKMEIINKELELAWSFVEKTNRNIFLTGKAGTGKTTFLHNVKSQSLKRLVVVAPTGVAAINARGVTIHSFFQLAFGPIIPNVTQQKSDYKMSRQKIDIIKSLDLLIIDEVSMVRADLLDGIDQVLRRFKNKNKVFGGVQVLMIGDLQQLSPVVKSAEWDLLRSHYDTAYFFSSKSFKKADVVSIELKHIYRQDNEKFIAILNEIRNDQLTQESADLLNTRYLPDFSPDENEGYITLTTHNNRAFRMNEIELNKIDDKSVLYKAIIKGKYNEHAFPTHEMLKLKKGAQVMFIKNDSSPEKRYFNGKIGKIIYLDNEEVVVKCPDDDDVIVTTPETWENIKYSINDETKEIKEDFVGSFTQMPFRLAWAITIHKSQGLTFDRAIIDAEASFAHGQTYVALSRCRTLEGIVLKNKINTQSIISDNRVASFTKNVEENPPSQEMLRFSEKKYQLSLIEELFNYQAFLYPLKRAIDIYYKNKTSIEGNTIEPLLTIQDKGVVNLLQVASSFKKQLENLSATIEFPLKDSHIQERISKAIEYYTKHTDEYIKTPLDALSFSTENKEIKKILNKQLQNIEELLDEKRYCFNGLEDKFEINKYLKLRAIAILQKTKQTRKKTEYIDTTEHDELFDELRDLRSIISQSEDIPPYQVFTQQSLYEMCRYFPVTAKQLRAINGMGKIRVKNYGEEIIEIIKNYVKKQKLTPREVADKKPKIKKGQTQQESLNLFKKGDSIEEIAKKRGLAITTIEGHLSSFIPTGEIDVTQLISKKKLTELKKLIKKTKFEGLNDLKAKLNDIYTYGELRIVLKVLEYEKSQKQ